MTLDDRHLIPTIHTVAAVRIAASVEVWPTWPTDPDPDAVQQALARARAAIRAYFLPLRDALDDDRLDLIDDDAEDVVRSEYDSDVLAVEGSAHLTVTPDEWLAIADGWLLDLDWIDDENGGSYRTDDRAAIPALPDNIVPTLGILDETGVIPAVAIEGTDRGWGDGGYEPAMVASLYVALALHDDAS